MAGGSGGAMGEHARSRCPWGVRIGARDGDGGASPAASGEGCSGTVDGPRPGGTGKGGCKAARLAVLIRHSGDDGAVRGRFAGRAVRIPACMSVPRIPTRATRKAAPETVPIPRDGAATPPSPIANSTLSSKAKSCTGPSATGLGTGILHRKDPEERSGFRAGKIRFQDRIDPLRRRRIPQRKDPDQGGLDPVHGGFPLCATSGSFNPRPRRRSGLCPRCKRASRTSGCASHRAASARASASGVAGASPLPAVELASRRFPTAIHCSRAG
jgi:hypothetical protein